MSKQTTVAVIGAGIVGLAISRSLAVRGYKVLLFERNPWAVGASVRNFGMVWPVGQPDGVLYNRAMLSRGIWKQVCTEAGIWHDEVGSLHAATSGLEAEAMQALAEHYGESRHMQWLNRDEALKKSPWLNGNNLHGALWSPSEMIVEAREAIGSIRDYLVERYDVQSIHTTAIQKIEAGAVRSGNRKWEADLVFVCSGTDFATIYPEHFYQLDITKCKLQMMRLSGFENNQRLGPALCGGLSLIHYKGFEVTPLVNELKKYYAQALPQYLQWGIHVMACQSPSGEITLGDTHEYGWHHDPFDKAFLNQMVVDYLGTFTHLAKLPVTQTWNGTYAKMTNGASEVVQKINQQVMVVNGLGGAGMTLSFGLAEEVVGGI